MKLDLEDENVSVIAVTAANVRHYFDGADIEEAIPGFEAQLDTMQGQVFGESDKVAYLVIEVRS